MADLNDVVTLSIPGTFEDMAIKLFNEPDLLVYEHVFKRFLHHTAAVHLQRKLQNVTLKNVGHGSLLQLISLLEELLNDI